jgi:hypothetical protein
MGHPRIRASCRLLKAPLRCAWFGGSCLQSDGGGRHRFDCDCGGDGSGGSGSSEDGDGEAFVEFALSSLIRVVVEELGFVDGDHADRISCCEVNDGRGEWEGCSGFINESGVNVGDVVSIRGECIAHALKPGFFTAC